MILRSLSSWTAAVRKEKGRSRYAKKRALQVSGGHVPRTGEKTGMGGQVQAQCGGRVIAVSGTGSRAI